MLDSAANTRTRLTQIATPDAVRSPVPPARTFESQLKARALLAVFCRDDILEARMSPDVQEILEILARAVAARPSRRHRQRIPTGGRS
ncbi:MAG TPA: hypothetical protein VGB82_00935 [Alphaproteobacteria bacterium]